MLQFFHSVARVAQKVFNHPQKMLNRPRHIRVSVVGNSLGDCLQKLESKAGLPKGDLSVKSDPMKVTTFPVSRRGLRHSVVSKTSGQWKLDNTNIGYIAGHIFEATGKVELNNEQELRMSPLATGAIQYANSITFFGSLHISKNCPGVYRDNICTTCGDISE